MLCTLATSRRRIPTCVLSIGLDTCFTDPVACVETLSRRLSGSGGGTWQRRRLQRPGPCPSAPAAARPLPFSACSGQALAQAAPAAARPLPRRRLQRPGPSDLQSLSLSKQLAMRAAPTSASHLHLSSSSSWRKISSSSRSCSARAHDRRTLGNVAFPERQQRPKRKPPS